MVLGQLDKGREMNLNSPHIRHKEEFDMDHKPEHKSL